jgi:uncharacterized protein
MSNEEYKKIRASVKEGRKEDVIALVDANPEAIHENGVFGTWLHVAASTNQVEVAKELIKRGVDINASGGILGGNALTEAASDGHYEMAKYLLEAGSEMDVSASERNPLFNAILGDKVKIAQLLIDHGIDINIKYSGDLAQNMTAFTVAKEQGARQCLKLLEETKKKAK